MPSTFKPVLSIPECHRLLTQPGSPFETLNKVVNGRLQTVYKNAPTSFESLWKSSLNEDVLDKEFIVYEDDRMTYRDAHTHARAVSNLLVKKFNISKKD